MMPPEADFKGTSVACRNTCAVHGFLFPSHNPCTTGSPCTCWQELVIWNSLQGWAVKSLVGTGYSYNGKWRTKRKRRQHLLLRSLLSCQVSVPIREHWFPVTHSTVCALTSIFDKSASHNGPALVVMTTSGSPSTYWSVLTPSIVPLFKLIHNGVAECWLRTLIFNGDYQTVDWARHSGVVTSCDKEDS